MRGRALCPAGLVLAAGGGSRFGRPKALVEINGKTLVDRALDTLRVGGCDPVVVVIGARAEDVRALSSLDDAVVVENDAWASGMASSLHRGFEALTRVGAPAALIALVDQPGVTAEAVRRLIARWSDGAIAVVASYDGKPRNPVVLDATVWPDVLASATGDMGARAWLRAHPDDVVHVPCDDVAHELDLDVPADLDRYLTTTDAKDPQ